MTTTCKNLSLVKLYIKQVMGNLQQLHDYEGHEEGLENLKINTEHLLSKLEHMHLEGFKRKVKKRQKKKRNKNVKSRNEDIYTNDERQIDETSSEVNSLVTFKEPKKSSKVSKTIKECKRFLQNFELLEQLHLLRGQNSTDTYKFSLKLRQLKSLWNCLLQDKLQEQISFEDATQQQWNEVLFGPTEKNYFHDKPNLQNFVRKRYVWDSYINTKFGSPIPIGWVVPHEVREQWRPYLLPINN